MISLSELLALTSLKTTLGFSLSICPGKFIKTAEEFKETVELISKFIDKFTFLSESRSSPDSLQPLLSMTPPASR